LCGISEPGGEHSQQMSDSERASRGAGSQRARGAR
jgi:hypothetical protein